MSLFVYLFPLCFPFIVKNFAFLWRMSLPGTIFVVSNKSVVKHKNFITFTSHFRKNILAGPSSYHLTHNRPIIQETRCRCKEGDFTGKASRSRRWHFKLLLCSRKRKQVGEQDRAEVRR